MTKIGKTFNAHLIHNLFLSPYKRLKQLTACSRVRHNINVELNINKSKPLNRKKQVGYKNLTSKPLLDLYGDNPFGISHLMKEVYYCPALQGGATKKTCTKTQAGFGTSLLSKVKTSKPSCLTVHAFQKLFVAAGMHHVLFHELHSLFRLHIGQVIAEDEHTLQGILVQQQIFAACAGFGEVHTWIQATVGQVAIQL